MHGAAEQTSTPGVVVVEGPPGSPALGGGLPGILMRNSCLTRRIRQEGGLWLWGTFWEGGGVPSWRVAKGKAEQGWERENGGAKISAKCSRGA